MLANFWDVCQRIFHVGFKHPDDVAHELHQESLGRGRYPALASKRLVGVPLAALLREVVAAKLLDTGIWVALFETGPFVDQ